MWIDDEYVYRVGTLRTIADNYDSFEGYEPVAFIWGLVTNELELADYHADFDMAWEALSWRMQKIVDFDIQGLTDYELEAKGFYEPKKYKSIAYRKMANCLNGRR